VIATARFTRFLRKRFALTGRTLAASGGLEPLTASVVHCFSSRLCQQCCDAWPCGDGRRSLPSAREGFGDPRVGDPTHKRRGVGARVTRPSAAIAARTGRRNPASRRSIVNTTSARACFTRLQSYFRASTPRTAAAIMRLTAAIDRPPSSVGGMVAKPMADALS
jgi:hypothetical protein